MRSGPELGAWRHPHPAADGRFALQVTFRFFPLSPCRSTSRELQGGPLVHANRTGEGETEPVAPVEA